MKKNIKTQHVTEELSKGRVIFHAPTASEANMHTDISPSEKETSEQTVHDASETPLIPPQDHTGLPVLPMPTPVIEEPIHVEPIPVQTHEEPSPVSNQITHEIHSDPKAGEHLKEEMLKEEPQTETNETQIP